MPADHSPPLAFQAQQLYALRVHRLENSSVLDLFRENERAAERQAPQQQPSLQESKASAAAQKPTGGRLDCMVCMDAERRMVCLPCSCFVACESCAGILTTEAARQRRRPRCPACRKEVHKFMRINVH